MISALEEAAKILGSMVPLEFTIALISWIFFLWAISSFVISHRRIANSLERLTEQLDRMGVIKETEPKRRELEPKREEKDWEIGRPTAPPSPKGPAGRIPP
jgi:hypothetical protein